MTLRNLPDLVRSYTAVTISDAQSVISQTLTTGTNWRYPDARLTLDAVDRISNECCKVIDGSLILYKNYSDGDKPLQQALVDSMNNINDFFASEYLNQNRKLLSLLLRIQCDQVQQTLMDVEDQFLLTHVIKDLNQ